MTLKRGITIVATGLTACVLIAAISFALSDRSVPPCTEMLDGKTDALAGIEVYAYPTYARGREPIACPTVTAPERLAEIDAYLRQSAKEWERLDGEVASAPVAKFVFVRISGVEEEVTLVGKALITPEWTLRFNYDDQLMFESLIDPVVRIPGPVPSNPSPLTWLLQVVCR